MAASLSSSRRATVQASPGAQLRCARGAAPPLLPLLPLLLLGAALALPLASATAAPPAQGPVPVRLQPGGQAPAQDDSGLTQAATGTQAYAPTEDKGFGWPTGAPERPCRRLLNGNVQVDVSPKQPPPPQAASSGPAGGVSASLQQATVDVDSKSGSGCVSIPGIGRVGWLGGCR